MAVIIGSARIDERGKAYGGKAGDIYGLLRTGGLTPLPVAGDAWDASKRYIAGDTVTHGGISYTAARYSRGHEPGEDSLIEYWTVSPAPAETLVWADLDSGTDIPVGQLVTHNGGTWKCVKAHSKRTVRQPSAVQTDYWEAVE